MSARMLIPRCRESSDDTRCAFEMDESGDSCECELGELLFAYADAAFFATP
jgi:hypothetical protein